MTQFFIWWYISGVVGCIVGVWSDWYKGYDTTLWVVLGSFVFSIMGPFAILAAFCYLPDFKPFVILKGKRNDN